MLVIHNKICALYMDLFYDTSPDKVLNVSVCFYYLKVLFLNTYQDIGGEMQFGFHHVIFP